MNPRSDSDPVGLKPDPIETAACGFWAVVIMFGTLSASNRTRFGDSEWPWLDDFRIDPWKLGWAGYITIGLSAAVCYGALMGFVHWGLARVVPWPKAKKAVGWLFLVVVLLAGLILPYVFYRFPRMPWPPK